MKTYHSNEEVEKDIINGVLNINHDIKFDFDNLNINADIKCINIIAHNITGYDIKANDIKCFNIDVCNIIANNITANDIDTYNIHANNINANDIYYQVYCITYNDIKCNSIKGKRNNSFHKCLDGKLVIIDKNIVIIDGKEIELSNESYNELDGDGFEMGEGKGKSGI